jgi:hypothetical protein
LNQKNSCKKEQLFENLGFKPKNNHIPYMKRIIFGLSLIAIFSLFTSGPRVEAAGGKNNGTSSNGTIQFNTSDPQLKKSWKNLRDKIAGTIGAIQNRIDYLKQCFVARRSSHNPMTDDELKSMALSIKSDIDKAKEDVNNYMTNGDIFLSERDNYVQQIDGLKKVLSDMRVVDPADLDKS